MEVGISDTWQSNFESQLEGNKFIEDDLRPIAEPEESGNGGRLKWVSGRPGETPDYAGTDFIMARDGRIAALYLFFDKLN